MKDLIVQKYGGTSVGDVEKIKNVAARITGLVAEGKRVAVVVSAMGKTTDELIELAHAVNPNPPSREMDMLLATGEQVSIALLAMAIENIGYDVVSLTGAQCGIMTSDVHKRARIEDIQTERIENELNDGKIVIVAGFQGIDENNDITTLGRGGSDTSAVAIAAALKAEACEIYTDVEGVYTADPRVVKSARKIDEIAYSEVLEMANLGAGVLHPRAVELAEKYNVPLVVRASYNNNPGTVIKEESQVEQVVVRGIALDENSAKISVIEVPDQPGIAFRLFSELSDASINVDMIVQSVNHIEVNDISFTVEADALQEALAVTRKFADEVGAKDVLYNEDVAKLSVVGTGMAQAAGVASKFFGAIYELGINILIISTSEIKISCLIDKAKAKEAMAYVHDLFIGPKDAE